MMNEILILVLDLVIGILLGVIFFGGLWWTVEKVILSKRSVLWLLVSMLIRTSITLAGFYLVARGHWERLLICLLGFIIARFIVTHLTQTAIQPMHQAQEVHHASKSR